MTDLSRAIQLAPDDAASFRLRGDIRAESGDPVRAIEDYSKYLTACRPTSWRAKGAGWRWPQPAIMRAQCRIFARARTQPARTAARRTCIQPVSVEALCAGHRRLGPADFDRTLELSFVYCRGAARMLNGDGGWSGDIQSVMQKRPDIAKAQAAACGEVRTTPKRGAARTRRQACAARTFLAFHSDSVRHHVLIVRKRAEDA